MIYMSVKRPACYPLSGDILPGINQLNHFNRGLLFVDLALLSTLAKTIVIVVVEEH